MRREDKRARQRWIERYAVKGLFRGARSRRRYLMLDTVEIGRIYRVVEPIRTHCPCGTIIQPGWYLRVLSQTSPNRVWVAYGDTPGTIAACHKVRRSSVRRAVQEIPPCHSSC